MVLKKLPAILLAGTLLCAGFVLLLQSGWPELDAEASLKSQYAVIGLMLFHWMSILTIALLCAIVVVMKGHAYVMDAYELPDSEHPKPPDASSYRK